jgi:hypothetical protein
LESVRHRGRSSLDIETIYLSKGKIPDSFLFGAVSLSLSFEASHLSLRRWRRFQFYSCFISYSEKDRHFADRLHSDMQGKGVRRWFASEGLRIGDKFRSRIDESIRVYDKLLLILSQCSIASHWVEDEMEAALERERRENRIVLFPVRLDDALMKTDVRLGRSPSAEDARRRFSWLERSRRVPDRL